MAVVEAVVVVVMGVGVAVALVRAVGSNEDNSGDSDGRGPYNNQLKGPAEETTVAVTVTATETARAMVKATEKDENNAAADDGTSRTATRTTSAGCTSRLETSPLPWLAGTVRKNRNKIKFTAQSAARPAHRPTLLLPQSTPPLS